jgi:hypothetical protein
MRVEASQPLGSMTLLMVHGYLPVEFLRDLICKLPAILSDNIKILEIEPGTLLRATETICSLVDSIPALAKLTLWLAAPILVPVYAPNPLPDMKGILNLGFEGARRRHVARSDGLEPLRN